MTAHPFDAIDTPVDRDRWGRPLVVPPGGGKPVAYTRATTFAGTLDDTFALTAWKQRMTAIGLASDPSLVKAVASDPGDKQHVGRVVEQAMEAAQAGAAARTGTALHKMTERLDRGDITLTDIPDPTDRADLTAYLHATRGIQWLDIEGFGVLDDLKVAGTWDRVGVLPDGRVVIADLKTGSVDHGMTKIAIQLALYAHARPYNPADGTRGQHPAPVDLDTGLVIHLPAGSATCRLLEVDIAAGWDAVPLTVAVRDWRARRDLHREIAIEPAADTLPELIAAAAHPDQLTALWDTHRHQWTDQHTELAKARKTALSA